MGVRTFDTGEAIVYRSHGPTVLSAVLVGIVIVLGLVANGRPIGPGATLAGKAAASVCLAAAGALFFAAVGRRRPSNEAWVASLLFAFGTVAWAAAQSWSASPPAALFVAAAVMLAVRGEDDEAWAPRVALPLVLAVAANPADLALAAVFGLGSALRRPRQLGLFLLWAVPGLLVLAAVWGIRGVPSLPAAAPAAWVENAAALLASPALGLFIFAPVTLVGLAGAVRAAGREGDGPLALTCVASFLAHGVFTALFPLRGGTFGPVSWTSALPLVLLFVPEGLDALKGAGKGLALLSVAIQALGAFAYDGRWDLLHGPLEGQRSAVWDAASSPIAFQIRERVGIVALPELRGDDPVVREHRFVVMAPMGSRLSVLADVVRVEGVDATFSDAHLRAGARVSADRIALAAPGDGVFLRVRPESRARHLELRIAGRGRATLAVSEGSFWRAEPRVREKAVSGDFRIAFPYHYPESGGGDLTIVLRTGTASVAWISLVPATEPDDVFRLQGSPE